MAEERRVACSCGALGARLSGEPFSAAVCSCSDCQRRTGSAFGYSGYCDEQHVEISGDSRAWSRVSELGRRLEFHFCPVCGSTICWRAEFMPGRIGIALGNITQGDAPLPTVAIWDRRRHGWLGDLDFTECYLEGRF